MRKRAMRKDEAMMSDRTIGDTGFEARIAHLIHEAAKWKQGSGAHPTGLVKALAELREYFYSRAAHEPPTEGWTSEAEANAQLATIMIGAAWKHAERVVELEAEVSTLRESLAELARKVGDLSIAASEWVDTATKRPTAEDGDSEHGLVLTFMPYARSYPITTRSWRSVAKHPSVFPKWAALRGPFAAPTRVPQRLVKVEIDQDGKRARES